VNVLIMKMGVTRVILFFDLLYIFIGNYCLLMV
jgi:hypothetical protein